MIRIRRDLLEERVKLVRVLAVPPTARIPRSRLGASLAAAVESVEGGAIFPREVVERAFEFVGAERACACMWLRRLSFG